MARFEYCNINSMKFEIPRVYSGFYYLALQLQRNLHCRSTYIFLYCQGSQGKNNPLVFRLKNIDYSVAIFFFNSMHETILAKKVLTFGSWNHQLVRQGCWSSGLLSFGHLCSLSLGLYAYRSRHGLVGGVWAFQT